MRVVVIGTGYVGLCTGVTLASRGHTVKALDVRADVVATLNRGDPHVHEAGMKAMLEQTLATGRFSAHGVEPAHLRDAEIVIVAVGTPTTNGHIDLTQVIAAARFVGEYLRTTDECVSVVIKSTVVPGTTDTVVRGILEEESGKRLGDFGLGMNPEFLREGCALADCLEPDRIIVGYEEPTTRARLEQLYAAWGCEKIAVNSRTAEFIKYASNALLATQISAANELANLAGALGNIDILTVMRGVHADRRWSPFVGNGERLRPEILSYFVPGCGFGGSCLPKDVQALRVFASEHGVNMPVLRGVAALNSRQPTHVAASIERYFGTLVGKRILLLGLAFKAGTSDIRESRSLVLASEFVARGATVLAHDPVALRAARAALGATPITYLESWQDALEDVEAIVLATPWAEYEELMSPAVATRIVGKLVFDARRQLQPGRLPGVAYRAVGWTPSGLSPAAPPRTGAPAPIPAACHDDAPILR